MITQAFTPLPPASMGLLVYLSVLVHASAQVVKATPGGPAGDLVGQVGDFGDLDSLVTGQMAQLLSLDCHLVVITAAQYSTIFSSIIRYF